MAGGEDLVDTRDVQFTYLHILWNQKRCSRKESIWQADFPYWPELLKKRFWNSLSG